MRCVVSCLMPSLPSPRLGASWSTGSRTAKPGSGSGVHERVGARAPSCFATVVADRWVDTRSSPRLPATSRCSSTWRSWRRRTRCGKPPPTSTWSGNDTAPVRHPSTRWRTGSPPRSACNALATSTTPVARPGPSGWNSTAWKCCSRRPWPATCHSASTTSRRSPSASGSSTSPAGLTISRSAAWRVPTTGAIERARLVALGRQSQLTVSCDVPFSVRDAETRAAQRPAGVRSRRATRSCRPRGPVPEE